MKRLLFLIAVLVYLISSCKKDKDIALPESLVETAWKGEYTSGDSQADASLDFDQEGKLKMRFYDREEKYEYRYGPYLTVCKPRSIQLKDLDGNDVELWFVESYNGKEMTLVNTPGSAYKTRTLKLKRIF